MRKLKDVLRLHALGLKQQQIARSCQIAQSTVHEYIQAAQAASVGWPLPADWGDRQLEEALFPQRPQPEPGRKKDPPEFATVHQELQTHRHLTLQLVWEEYRQGNPDGYGYSHFCELYRRWVRKLDVVLRQEHRAGEKLFVDYAGARIPIYDPQSGAVRSQAALFVAVLGASNYPTPDATESQDLACWIGSHIRSFEFYGGVPRLVIPDNAKTGVSKACRYEPDLNPTYQEMAAHYGVAVVPARPYKPRDKAKVEVGVQLVQRWIVAALRHRRFFSLEELNQAIGELLERLNQRPFRKREGSRASLFAALDRPALGPLPAQRYEFGQWIRARVNIDYHIEVDRHFYSVPHTLVHQPVEVRRTASTVEILHRGVRVASHARSLEPYRATTIDEHRPKSHRKHLAWTPSRLVEWGRTVGPATAQLVETILAHKPHPEMGYRSCLGILRLAGEYPHDRVEAAAQRALRLHAASYQSLKSILEKQLDRLPVKDPACSAPSTPPHSNLRGAGYFGLDSEPEPPAIH